MTKLKVGAASKSLKSSNASKPSKPIRDAGRKGAVELRDALLYFAPHQASLKRDSKGPLRFRRITSATALREAYDTAPQRSLWLLRSSAALAVLTSFKPRFSRDQRLLCMTSISPSSEDLIGAYFQQWLALSENLAALAPDVLREVVSSAESGERFIAAAFDAASTAIVLYRGNLDRLVIPLAWFANMASGAVVDPAALAVIDYGQTVCLGSFEASADAILYEFDDEYRRAVKRRALAQDTTLGGSLRRLRLQRGLTQDAFPGVPAKTIARIERSEVTKPHHATLAAVAKRLGVSVADLATY